MSKFTRDQPTEFFPVLGAEPEGKQRAQRAGEREAAKPCAREGYGSLEKREAESLLSRDWGPWSRDRTMSGVTSQGAEAEGKPETEAGRWESSARPIAMRIKLDMNKTPFYPQCSVVFIRSY